MHSPARIAVSLGDPCGIGPEVVLKALRGDAGMRRKCILAGDYGVLVRTAKRIGWRGARILCVHEPEQASVADAIWLVNRPFPELAALRPGQERKAAGRAAYAWLTEAAGWVRDGRAAALATAPVSKAAVAASVRGFTGQTETVARIARTGFPVMMLAGRRLRVVPATRHVPLSAVPRLLKTGALARTIAVTAHDLKRWFGVRRPRIAVCGLNPHAGEGGLLGREEARIVTPAIRMARRRGIDANGPFPADAVFASAIGGAYDAVVAMYHDQALIPVKTFERNETVNATLGLPFLRTSPAHGTAFDIAGRGIADPASMRAALKLALDAAGRRG